VGLPCVRGPKHDPERLGSSNLAGAVGYRLNRRGGHFLVKLDDAVLRTDRAKQLVDVSTSEAALAEAQNDLEALRIAKQEYEEGTFKQEEAELESELLVAEENIRRAESCLKWSRKMLSRG
jgi:HlyD family secretion protein